MKDFMYESNLETYYKELDIDIPKFRNQRLMYTIVLTLLGIIISGALVISVGIHMIVLGVFITILSGFIGWKWMYFQLSSASIANKKRLDLLFPEFLTTFISLLNAQTNSNVITAIEGTIPYMKEPIKSQLIMLVRRIYDDSSIENAYYSFQEFSNSINNKESEQILSLLLDMYISGINKETLNELQERIEKMKQNQISEYATWKNGRLRNKASITSLGMAIFFIFAWIGIVASHYLKAGLAGANL